jgi:BolA-like protein 3
MFRIHIESPLFLGKSLVQQHRYVNEALKDDIKQMHGLQLITKPTSSIPRD